MRLVFYRQRLLCLPFGICSLDRRRKEIAKMGNGKCVWKWMEDYTVEYYEMGGDCVYSVLASKEVWEWKSVLQ